MTPPPKTPIYQKVKQTLAEKPDELVKYEELIDIKIYRMSRNGMPYDHFMSLLAGSARHTK